MENYPSLEEYDSTTSVEDENNGYQGFFTTEQINSIADGFSYKDQIFNLGLQLGISHSISMQLKSRYDNLFTYAVDVILLWRETYNTGDFEACRELDSTLRAVSFGKKAAELVSGFLKWINRHVCCREIVEKNAKYAITKLSKSKKSTGLRQSVVAKFNTWCKQQKLEINNFNMALYFQLFGSQLYEKERDYMEPFNTSLSYLNTSMKHHLPHDAFYLTVITNIDMENNVVVSSSYLVKEITEFLHPRRLAKICDGLPGIEVVHKLTHSLDVPEKIYGRAKFRNPDSMFMIAYDILNAWKQDCPFLGEEDQVNCLTAALEDIEMDYLAYEIKEEFKVWQNSPASSKSEFQICSCEMKSKKRPITSVVGVEKEEQNRIKSIRTENT